MKKKSYNFGEFHGASCDRKNYNSADSNVDIVVFNLKMTSTCSSIVVGQIPVLVPADEARHPVRAEKTHRLLLSFSLVFKISLCYKMKLNTPGMYIR